MYYIFSPNTSKFVITRPLLFFIFIFLNLSLFKYIMFTQSDSNNFLLKYNYIQYNVGYTQKCTSKLANVHGFRSKNKVK